MPRERRKKEVRAGGGRRGGCGFLLTTTLFACCMLIVNGLLITGLFPTVYAIIARLGPQILRDRSVAERVLQGAMFVGPVVLLVVEWYLLDKFMLRAERQHSTRRPG